MIEVVFTGNPPYAWAESDKVAFRGFVWDANGSYWEGNAAAGLFSGSESQADVQRRVRELNGAYSVVLRLPEGHVLACDASGFFSLFYRKRRGGWLVSDDPMCLLDGNRAVKRNEAAAAEFLAAGYVTGNETLAEGIYRIRPGEAVFLGKELHAIPGEPFRFRPGSGRMSDFTEAMRLFGELLERQSRLLVNSLQNRTAVVPLSGGYDSRLIACMLHKAGHQNVICVTYGRRNRETWMSEKVASGLGFPWIFVDYETIRPEGIPEDPLFRAYCRQAGGLGSMPYLQEYFTVRHLNENKLIPEDSIFLPGHPGDNLGGSFTGKGATGRVDPDELPQHLVNTFFRFVPVGRNTAGKIAQRVSRLIRTGRTYTGDAVHGFIPEVETWNFNERLPKFIFNSAKVFPFFGYAVRFPLWSNELAEFFAGLPYSFRQDKLLYNKVLEEKYFEPLQVSFGKREIMPGKGLRIPEPMKAMAWRFLPASLLQAKAAKNDWICYTEFTRELAADLSKHGIKPISRYRSLNALICQWYLENAWDGGGPAI